MNVFHQIRLNIGKILDFIGRAVVALLCLWATVACVVGVADCVVGILTGPRIGLGDGLIWGFAVAYLAALGSGAVVFGRLTQLTALGAYRELNKLHDEWAIATRPAKKLGWVDPAEAKALLTAAGVAKPEYALLSAYFVLRACSCAIFDMAHAERRATNAEEKEAIGLLQETACLLDPKTARVRPFRRTSAELARN